MKKKKILSLALLATMLVIPMTISSVKAVEWVEVVRWSGSDYDDFTTESFNCDHVEWRIIWSYVAYGYPLESLLYIEIFEEEGNESERISFILKEGYYSKSGYKNIHNKSGTFHLRIVFLNVDECTVIIEQDIDSIPEFTPAALIITLIAVSILIVTLSKKMNISPTRIFKPELTTLEVCNRLALIEGQKENNERERSDEKMTNEKLTEPMLTVCITVVSLLAVMTVTALHLLIINDIIGSPYWLITYILMIAPIVLALSYWLNIGRKRGTRK